jgi:phosphoribosyl 1,2-cyclic phosphodiesterase
MKIRFWGTRGSIPVSLTAKDVRAKLATALAGAQGQDLTPPGALDAYLDGLGFETTGTFGGHSSCVQLETGGPEHVILDLGSGVRPFAQRMLEQHGPAAPQTYHVFLSHLHWDHIMGLPFFTPAYIPGNRVIIHACHPNVEHALRRQQREPSFPVGMEIMGADISFDVMQPGRSYDIAGMRVRAHLQSHAGDSYGWRFEQDGKSVVYSTDSEHHVDDEAEQQGFVDFFHGADTVIFDAMYSLAETFSVKEDWGHSSNIVAVELCQAAKVRRLVMFHHEPAYDDAQIAQVLRETRRFEEITRDDHAVEVLSAWDGLELDL